MCIRERLKNAKHDIVKRIKKLIGKEKGKKKKNSVSNYYTGNYKISIVFQFTNCFFFYISCFFLFLTRIKMRLNMLTR